MIKKLFFIKYYIILINKQIKDPIYYFTLIKFKDETKMK